MKSLPLKIRMTRRRDDCGYIAVASLYRHYGLDPQRLGLRQRLNTAIDTLPDGTRVRTLLHSVMDRLGLRVRGVTCPDIFAALYADGYRTSYASGPYAGYRAMLLKHLRSGHPALALANGTRFVIVAGADDDGVLVFDPAGNRRGQRLTHSDFEALACGVLLVRRRANARSGKRDVLDLVREYARGLDFNLRCLGMDVPEWVADMAEP